MNDSEPAEPVGPARSSERLVWGGLLLTVVAITVAFSLSRWGGSSRPDPLPRLFQVPDFVLTNQHGQRFGLSDLRGKVWLADIIFTRCGGPCPTMTARMAELQRAIPAAAAVRFVTLTTDPEHDTAAVLRAYGERHQAVSNRWHFLTGTKQQIGALAIDGLKLVVVEKPQAERDNDRDLFVHSTLFVLVDGRGVVRGVIDADGSISGGIESDRPDFQPRALAAIRQLLQEK